MIIEQSLETAIHKAIEFYIKEEIEKECKKVSERVERSIREKVGMICATVVSKLSMEYTGYDKRELLIRVHFENFNT